MTGCRSEQIYGVCLVKKRTCPDKTPVLESVLFLSSKIESMAYCALKSTRNPPRTCNQASQPTSGTLPPAALKPIFKSKNKSLSVYRFFAGSNQDGGLGGSS